MRKRIGRPELECRRVGWKSFECSSWSWPINLVPASAHFDLTKIKISCIPSPQTSPHLELSLRLSLSACPCGLSDRFPHMPVHIIRAHLSRIGNWICNVTKARQNDRITKQWQWSLKRTIVCASRAFLS